MPRQRPDDLRQLKTEELELKLAQLVEEQFRLKFRRATEAIANPLQFRTMRRDIARIKTVLRTLRDRDKDQGKAKS
jgi:large subunit ribosomal protein L29